MERALKKDVARLDEMCRRLIAASPMVFVASYSADGHCDVTPRGGPPGFVSVLDERRLAIPDATGNRRLDTLTNVVATGRAGLIFLIPGRDTTLRVNGPACVTADAGAAGRAERVGKPPRTAIVSRRRRPTPTARRRSCARSSGTRRPGRRPMTSPPRPRSAMPMRATRS